MATHVTHLKLDNWRNFRHVDVRLQPRVFVVGPNASGKSNLLDALRFLHDLARPEGSLLRAINDRGGFAHVRSLHAKGPSNVRVEATVEVGDQTWRYALELSGTRSRPVEVVAEDIERDGEVVEARAARSESPRLREQTYLQQAAKNDGFRPLVDALAALNFVHVVPQVARAAARSDELNQRIAPGSDFIDQLAMLPSKKQRGALTRIERALRVAVPGFSSLKVERDDLGRPHLSANYAHWRPQGGWQNEQDFSDGTLRLIGLLWAIEHGDGPVVLEEPELSLHRDVIRQLPRIFARLAQRTGRQFLVTTHAEEMLVDSGIDPSEVLLLQPEKGSETGVVLGSDRDELVAAAQAGLPLAKLVTSFTRPSGVDQLSLDFRADR